MAGMSSRDRSESQHAERGGEKRGRERQRRQAPTLHTPLEHVVGEGPQLGQALRARRRRHLSGERDVRERDVREREAGERG